MTGRVCAHTYMAQARTRVGTPTAGSPCAPMEGATNVGLGEGSTRGPLPSQGEEEDG